jgi:phosphoadenosine phosphosulfate reductase
MILDRHENIVLCFSGGKDSIAALHMMRDYWDKIKVVWVNTGSALPETIKQMDKVRDLVPHFVEIKTNQKEDIELNGMPVDVLPHQNSLIGSIAQGGCEHKMRLFFDCCANNIWKPMSDYVKSNNVTLIIRGQKASDHHKAPVKTGDVIDGIEYFFPLENMTDSEVVSYLKEHGIELPKHYEYVNSSLDCWNCTAYMFDNVGRVKYLKDHYPDLHEKLVSDLKIVKAAIEQPLKFINEAI